MADGTGSSMEEEPRGADSDWELLDSLPTTPVHPAGGGGGDGARSDHFVLLNSLAAGSDEAEGWSSDDSERVGVDGSEVVLGVDGIGIGIVSDEEAQIVQSESQSGDGAVEERDGEEPITQRVESVEPVVVEEEFVAEEEKEVVAESNGRGSEGFVGEDGDLVEVKGGIEVEGVAGGGVGDGEGEKKAVWWKGPLEFLKLYAFRLSPVWSASIAAAVVGIFALARSLSRSKHKPQPQPQPRRIPLKISVDDKFEVQAKRLNGAFSFVQHVPIYKVIYPSRTRLSLRPWPMLEPR